MRPEPPSTSWPVTKADPARWRPRTTEITAVLEEIGLEPPPRDPAAGNVRHRSRPRPLDAAPRHVGDPRRRLEELDRRGQALRCWVGVSEHHHRVEPGHPRVPRPFVGRSTGRSERRGPRYVARGPGPVPRDVPPRGRVHLRVQRDAPRADRAGPARRGSGNGHPLHQLRRGEPQELGRGHRRRRRRGRVLRLHGSRLPRGVLDPRRRGHPPDDRGGRVPRLAVARTSPSCERSSTPSGSSSRSPEDPTGCESQLPSSSVSSST